ncbi:hypothetical protein [Mycobacterium simulans]|uniref:hypothetical protein n=1 Tax=Mycobacterium simulans TaxID=627089 RepID=UPI00163E4459|nr:hypothetical protein [Mycobacterium simulans]
MASTLTTVPIRIMGRPDVVLPQQLAPPRMAARPGCLRPRRVPAARQPFPSMPRNALLRGEFTW